MYVFIVCMAVLKNFPFSIFLFYVPFICFILLIVLNLFFVLFKYAYVMYINFICPCKRSLYICMYVLW